MQFVAGFVVGILIVPVVALLWTLLEKVSADALPLHRERRQMFHKEE